MQKRLSFMVSEKLFEQIEWARGDVPRERWLRRAVEQALDETRPSATAVMLSDVTPPARSGVASTPGASGPTPAEQPDVQRAVRGAREVAARAGGLVGQLLEDAADAAEQPGVIEELRVGDDVLMVKDDGKDITPVRREFRPYPKGGKR